MRHLAWKWCALSMCTTLGLLWLIAGTQIIAKAPPAQPAPENPAPTLTLQDCLVQVTEAPTKLDIGKAPTLTLTITNTTDQPVDLQLPVTMMCQDWTPPFSRMMMMPTEAWTDVVQLKLKPNAEVTHTITPTYAAKAGSTLTFYFSGKQLTDPKTKMIKLVGAEVGSYITSQPIAVQMTEQQKKMSPQLSVPNGRASRAQAAQVRNIVQPKLANLQVQNARQVR
jgi:hypothetical protein